MRQQLGHLVHVRTFTRLLEKFQQSFECAGIVVYVRNQRA
jgi:hypothetical protein